MQTLNRNHLKIETPEGISFSLPLASPMIRLFAFAIDFAIVNVIMQIVSVVLAPAQQASSDFGAALLILINFFVHIGYAILLEWTWRGQTVGKRLFRLRVMDSQGLHLQFNQVFMRNLLRVIDSLPAFYLVGGICSHLNSLSQRLGDIAGNTVVVRTPKPFIPNISQLGTRKFNSFKAYPHLCARLRQLVSPHEANVAFSAILRKDQLDEKDRLNLYTALDTHFSSLVSFPEESRLGLTSEQAIHNVLEIIYQS